ncbi:MAG: class I SAM-dependent methyltransferase, partial [Candidatus Omnitrophica bacterium]|nr:class I SAM-dependent methyltransferase [Candidatus Omnitrophota bacterium]
MSEKFILPKSESPRMFNAIAGRYDLLNSLLSLGRHARWRQRLKEFLPPGGKLSVLDLATGTADVLITLVKNNPNIDRAIGIDLSEGMLEIGKSK